MSTNEQQLIQAQLSRKQMLEKWKETKGKVSNSCGTQQASQTLERKDILRSKENKSTILGKVQQQPKVDDETITDWKAKSKQLSKTLKLKAMEHENLQTKFDSLQKLYTEQSDLVASLKSSFEAKFMKQDTKIETLSQQLESLQNDLMLKDELLEGFAETYVPQIYHQESVRQLEDFRTELRESEELTNLLKEQLAFYEKQHETRDETCELASMFQQAATDLALKDDLIRQLQEALAETLSENELLYQMKQQFKHEQEEFVDACEVETQTDDVFEKELLRDFNCMKVGNDLMYQQMMEIQKNAKLEVSAIRKQLQALMEEREENLQEARKWTVREERYFCEVRDLKLKIQKINESNENLVSKAFEQAEKLAMSQIQETIEKYQECERKLEEALTKAK